MRNPVLALVWWIGVALSRLGLVDRQRAERTTTLAWPRIVTGIARVSQSAADLAMVGVALGPTAIAGIGYATPFWQLAVTVGGGIAGGTISQVSQRYGAGLDDELALVVKQAALVTGLAALPFTAVYALVPGALVDLLAADPLAVGYGATYLGVLGTGVAFTSLNIVGSRALVGADDAYSSMMLRAGGAVLNLALNAVLVFGLELGVFGAAVGTVVSSGLVTACFAWGFLGGWIPGVGRFPITVDLGPPHVDRDLLGQLFDIAVPTTGTGLATMIAQFPLFALLATFGPNVAAAFVVARRVRGLLNAPGWGFSLASSSLVGQHLGRGAERGATVYGRDIMRFSLAVYLLLAAVVFAVPRPVARLFVSDPSLLPMVADFVRVAAVSVLGSSIYGSASEPLRTSGDARWPLYAKLGGLYAVTLPVVYLGSATPLGRTGLYLALLAETVVPAVIVLHRFRSGEWRVVSRSYRPEPAD